MENVEVYNEALDEQGSVVRAGDGRKYLNIDGTVKVRWNDFDVYHFQLVKEKAAELGKQENVGDNLEEKKLFDSALADCLRADKIGVSLINIWDTGLPRAVQITSL
ncbi:hypothetical protein MYX84_11175 [Acidobacteria bacterium AH-259-O06]|nr:hypothetical protein [Acidobacteria bacterium AH-259-O06]